MQLMPATAGDLGIHDPEHDAETSIRAGTLYLKRQLDGFEPRIPLEARIRFALASYNAGRGHVQDARRLAARKGWSPDRWYGHVEKAMLLLQEPEYYEDARYGYCRGSETVSYVRGGASAATSACHGLGSRRREPSVRRRGGPAVDGNVPILSPGRPSVAVAPIG
jgi:membrane-bound lytic murein transglycosylase MltF